ncbi:MAG: DsbA family protein [Amaricoccus sp.]|uniref:DsbA family protein n=1 Tax=Amaricoccus sp. TaxID=1872485 RepID=UPI0039E5F303
MIRRLARVAVATLALAAASATVAQEAAPGAAAAQNAVPGAAAAPQLSSPFSSDQIDALHAEIRSYLLANPEIVMEMVKILDQKQKAAAATDDKSLVAANAPAIFDDGFSWVGGNPDGRLTIVEFLDYQCGYCRKAQPEITALLEKNDNVRLIVKEMPILGPGSDLAARAAVATMVSEGPEAYGRLHQELMSSKGQITDASLDRAFAKAGVDGAKARAAMDDPEVTRRIDATHALAETLGISGTPTFVLADTMVRGYIPLAQIEGMLEQARAVE